MSATLVEILKGKRVMVIKYKTNLEFLVKGHQNPGLATSAAWESTRWVSCGPVAPTQFGSRVLWAQASCVNRYGMVENRFEGHWCYAHPHPAGVTESISSLAVYFLRESLVAADLVEAYYGWKSIYPPPRFHFQ